jgi:hypothetical protein
MDLGSEGVFFGRWVIEKGPSSRLTVGALKCQHQVSIHRITGVCQLQTAMAAVVRSWGLSTPRAQKNLLEKAARKITWW